MRGPAFFVKSNDGGSNWTVVNLTAAGVMNGIMDVHFLDLTNGWVVGMDTNAFTSGCPSLYHGCIAHTTNGGLNWTPVVVTPLTCCYFWKMAWPSPQTGYASLQQDGTISAIIYYKTTNGGQTWVSNAVPISVVSDCAFYLQGIGFSDTNTGWMGGATCATYQEDFVGTTDGGSHLVAGGLLRYQPHEPAQVYRDELGLRLRLWLASLFPPLAITNPPTSQFVLGGSNAVFQVGAYALTTPGYQWLLNGVPIPGATNSNLVLTNAGRANEGSYSVVVSNSYGAVISPNATLQVAVPQVFFEAQMLIGGGVHLGFGDWDGSPLTSNDLINFELDASSNLRNWVPLNLPFSLSNGTIQVGDPTNYPARFYRVIEH